MDDIASAVHANVEPELVPPDRYHLLIKEKEALPLRPQLHTHLDRPLAFPGDLSYHRINARWRDPSPTRLPHSLGQHPVALSLLHVASRHLNLERDRVTPSLLLPLDEGSPA